jgi:hypothetical protein
MSDSLAKSELFLTLGYGDGHELLERALEEAGLSRPDKTGIAAAKLAEVRRILAGRFSAVCSRGDCRKEAAEEADGRTVVLASSQEECAICGGSANQRAVDAMVAALEAADMSRLCVVGGSPNARVELERLVGGRLQTRLVDGTVARNAHRAHADLAWADRVAVWGSTMLDHKVSLLYKGPKVIQFARRSIQALAREVSKSVE